MSDKAAFKQAVMTAISDLRAQHDLTYPEGLLAVLEVVTQYASICVAGIVTLDDIERLKIHARQEARDAIIARLSTEK